jgi:hypothetical protein
VSIVEPLQPGGLPNLGVDLKGALPLQLRGNFVLTPGPGNVFEGLPDTPITRFELNFDADKLIVTTRDLCVPPRPAFHGDFEGHNGAKVSGGFPATVKGCGSKLGRPSAKVKLRKSQSEHPRMKAKVKAGAEAQVEKMKLKLPRQLRFANGSDFKKGAKASADLAGGREKAKVTDEEGTETLKLRVKGKGLGRVRDIKKGKKLKFPITVTDVNGEKTKIKARAKAR